MAKSRSLQQAVRFALTTATAAAGVSALHAQEAPAPAPAAAPIEEVVVTGSRLKTPNETAISPVTTISSTDLQQTGLTRVEDVLSNMPQIFAGMNSTTSNGADGTASINLRGLGPTRTLVLVNGLRLGPGSALGGRNFADVNQVPAAMIERVDVLTGGASAVYGADAVAGVVNFILNTHFEGVRVDAGYHFNQHHNDNQTGTNPIVTSSGFPLPSSNVDTGFGKYGSVIMGSNFADNKGNATAYVTYDNQGQALQASYDYSACTLGTNKTVTKLVCKGSSTSAKNGAGGRFLAYSSHGTTILDHTVDGTTGQFRPFTQPNDLFNYGPINFYQTPNERWTGGVFLNYDVNSHVNVYTSVMYMRNEQAAQIAPGGDFGDASFIPCADPLLTAQEVSVICNPANLAAQGNPYETYNGVKYPGVNMYPLRRNVEGGPRIATFLTNSAREVLGIKGDFGDAHDAWTYNASAQHSTVDTLFGNLNYLNNIAIEESLNVLPGATAPGVNNGAPVCGGPTQALGIGPLVAPGTAFSPDPACVPWNIWHAHGVTPQQLAFLSIPVQAQGTVTEYVVDGSVTGDLGKYGVKTPWADQGLQLNVGVEWREDSSNYQPDAVSQAGTASGAGGATPALQGAYHVKEAFTEMRLPIASHQPWAEDLSIEGGYRRSDYTLGFNTNTYKGGFDWQPIRDIRFRGSYERAVRAPNIGELYTPQAVGLDGSEDPCAYPLAAGSTTTLINGVTAAQCARSGVAPNRFGHISQSTAYQYNGLLSGNPHLQPEEADTYTIGWIATPRFLPNFSWGVDYFHIKIDNKIGPIGENAILAYCTYLDQLCNQVHRDSTGSLWLTSNGFVTDPNLNQGELITAGLDFKGNYRLPLTGLGSLLFSLEATKLNELKTEPIAGQPSYDCVGLWGAICGGGNPKWRSVFDTTWSTPWAGLDVNLRWRYYGNGENEGNSGQIVLSTLPYQPLAHIPAYSYFDLAASFNVYKNIRLRLGVNNITDKVPPLVVGAACTTSSPNASGANCNGNTYPGIYDAMGRYVFTQLTAQF
jgi:outer membrane receptor protein involved in Fe transport